MPMFQAEAELFTIHSGAQVAKSLQEFQRAEMQIALRQFLKACLRRIPSRTGFLRAAFSPIRQAFGGGQQGADLNPQLAELFGGLTRQSVLESFNKANTTDRKGRPLSAAGQAAVDKHRRIEEERRNRAANRRDRKQGNFRDLRRKEWYYPSKGRRVEKTPANARQFLNPSDPERIIKIRSDTVFVEFDIGIHYYRINDWYHRIVGSPWHSMDAGFQAMLNYLENSVYRYPWLTELLVTQKIFLRGSRVRQDRATESNKTAAKYRGRFGSQFHPTAGQLIPESSIDQSSDLGDVKGPSPHYVVAPKRVNPRKWPWPGEK